MVKLKLLVKPRIRLSFWLSCVVTCFTVVSLVDSPQRYLSPQYKVLISANKSFSVFELTSDVGLVPMARFLNLYIEWHR
jgi:hypothetical protein